jgi:hypothetical protein
MLENWIICMSEKERRRAEYFEVGEWKSKIESTVL